MSKTTGDKIKELEEFLTDRFDLRGSRQHYILFPQEYEKKILELQVLLTDKFGVAGKAKIITLAACYLIDEIANSKEFEEKVEADNAKKDGKEV